MSRHYTRTSAELKQLGHPNKSNLEWKRTLIEALRRSDQPSLEILRSFPFVYIGSHTDIATALLLGGRIIHLVDPQFQNPGKLNCVQETIERITQLPACAGPDGSLHFQYDFGQGDERVSVRCICARLIPQWSKKMNLVEWEVRVESNELDEESSLYYVPLENMPEYVAPDRIGCALAFYGMGAFLDHAPCLLEAIVPNGILFENRGHLLLDRLINTPADIQAISSNGDIAAFYERHTAFSYRRLNVCPHGCYSFLQKRPGTATP